MEHDEFIDELKEKFWNKGTFFKKHGHALEDSILSTIKSYLLKKNLVIISKTELAKLENKAANIPEGY